MTAVDEAAFGRVHRVHRVGGLQRSVSNLQRSIAFYCGGLGFAVMQDGLAQTAPLRARLALGHEHIDLVQAAAAQPPRPACAPDPRFQHAAVVAADIEAAWQRLQPFAPVAISQGGPQRLPANAGGVSAVKFRDPDGHPLELIEFPAGTGDARWQPASNHALTLGIDHFALVVGDVERSITFFASFGFRVAARQTNRGVEQSRLDGLAEAVVEVVALTAATSTPHLELLGYGSPRVRVSASAREHTNMLMRDVISLIGDNRHGRTEALVDPDGHAFALTAESAFEGRF